MAKQHVQVVERPGGTYFVEARRKGVEPVSGLLPFDLVAILTRLRWRPSGQATWVVEVLAPLSRQRWNRSKRLIYTQNFASKADALAALIPTSDRLQAGEFDEPPM